MVPVRFGYGSVQGAVRAVPVFGSDGSSRERFSRCFCAVLSKRHGSGFGFQRTVPTVPVLLPVSEETVPAVPVSGPGLVPALSCTN